MSELFLLDCSRDKFHRYTGGDKKTKHGAQKVHSGLTCCNALGYVWMVVAGSEDKGASRYVIDMSMRVGYVSMSVTMRVEHVSMLNLFGKIL